MPVSLLLTLKMQADSSDAKSELRSFGSDLAGFAGGAAKAVAGVAAVTVGAVGAIGATLGALTLKGGFERAMNIEEAQAKLKGIGKSAQDVTEIMKNAVAAVTGTSFGLGEAATIAASAVAAGVKPGQELEKYLRLTANAAALTGREIGDMGSVLNKVTTRGKASTEEINQLNEAGIPILVNLAKHYKVSTEAMSDMVTKGKVDAKTFQLVLTETVGNAAEEMGKTVGGSFKNMRTAMSRLGETFLSGAFTAIPALLQAISRAFDALKPAAKSAGASFGAFATNVVQNLVRLIDNRLVPAFAAFGAWLDRLKGMLALFRLGRVGEEAEQSSNNINTKLLPSMHDIGEWIIKVAVFVQERLIPAIQNGIDRVKEWFDKWRQLIYDVSGLISNKLFGAWRAIFDFLYENRIKIENWFSDWKQLIYDVSGLISNKLFGAWRTIFDFITEHKEEILGFLHDHKEDIEKVAAGVGLAVTAWGLAKEGIEDVQAATEVLTGIQEAFNLVTEANPWVLAGAAIIAVLLLIGLGILWLVTKTETGRDLWNTAWEDISNAAQSVWDDVLKPIYDWFQEKWNQLWADAEEAMKDFKEAWPTIRDAIVDTYEKGLKPLVDFINGNMESFKNFGIVLGVIAAAFVLMGIVVLALTALLLGLTVGLSVLMALIVGVIFVILMRLINIFWDVFNNVRDAVGGIIDIVEEFGQVVNDIFQNVISFAWNLIQVFWDLYNNIADAVGKAKDWIVDRFTEILEFIGGLPNKISSAASGMWDGIKEAFKTAINWIIDKWNGLEFTLPNFPGTDFGGFTIHPWPQIPKLAAGGVVRRPTLAMIGEAGPEAVVPLGRMGGTTINVNVTHTGLAVDNPRLQRDLVETLSRFVARNGPLQLPVRNI
jgi:tape measure domain-containing protein